MAPHSMSKRHDTKMHKPPEYDKIQHHKYTQEGHHEI